MIKFFFFDSFDTRMVNKVLLYALKYHADWFDKQFKIQWAYGTPPSCIWNGTTVEFGQVYRPEEWKKYVLDMYEQFGVHYCLLYTNSQVNNVHLTDVYANALMKISDLNGNLAIVSIPIMKDYLQKFSNLGYCWSSFAYFGNTLEESFSKINDLSEENLVVLCDKIVEGLPDFKILHPQNLVLPVNKDGSFGINSVKMNINSISNYNLLISDIVPVCSEKDGGRILMGNKDSWWQKLEKFESFGIDKFILPFDVNMSECMDFYLHFFVEEKSRNNFMEFYNSCNENDFGQFE